MNNNGVIYYKLEKRYDGDITKYCGLTGGEVDSNMFFLRGQDIERVKWDDEKEELIFTRVNGEVIRIEGINNPVTADETYYDPETGILYLTINNVTHEIKGFYVKEMSDGMTYSNSTLRGRGTIDNPISVSNNLRTGFFAPVEKLIDLTKEGETLPDDATHGSRFITKEMLNDYGLLYNFEGVKRVGEILKDESSRWRVPTHEDWAGMLNALEEEDKYRNHLSFKSNRFNGNLAGAKLKKGTYIWVLFETKEFSQVENGSIKPLNNILPKPSHVEYVETLDENIFYEIEKEVDGVIVYEQYNCKDIWNESPYVTPSYDIKENYNFKVLPVGTADRLAHNYKEYFGRTSGFWSVSQDNETDVWSRFFFFDKDSVKSQGEGTDAYLSIRLVRDYEDNYSDVEIINGMPYSTVLMPHVTVNQNGKVVKEINKVWTVANISFAELTTEKIDKSPLAIHVKDDEGRINENIVYFINYWNGKSWEKQVFNNNEMIIMNTGPDGSKDEEWQLLNGTFVKRSKEIIDSVNAHTTDLVEKLINKHDGEVTNLINQHGSDIKDIWSQLEKNIQDRINADDALQSNINTEISDRETAIEDERKAREDADAELQDAINAEATARENAVTGEATARETLAETLRGELAVEVETLETAVTGEMEARVAADAELQNAIDAEATARENAVTGEATARETLAETLRGELAAETTARETAVTGEMEARVAADATLSAIIKKNNLISIVSPEHSVSSSFKQETDGTTITIDAALDSSCEFLAYDDAGLTDKGIKAHVQSVVDELGDTVSTYNERRIADIKALDTKIVGVDTSRLNDFNTLNAKIDKAVSDALVNDGTIYTKIEETKALFNTIIDDVNKSNADANAAIYQKIEENNNSRINSENTLDSKISNIDSKLEQNKILADSNLNTKASEIIATITYETNRATSVETSLSERIGTGYVGESITNRINTLDSNTTNKFNDIDETLSTNTNNISEISKRLDSFFNDAEISSQAIDTLKEIQSYISDHGEVASDIITNISKAQSAADAAQKDVNELENIVSNNKKDIEHSLELTNQEFNGRLSIIESDYLKKSDKDTLNTLILNEVEKLNTSDANIIKNCEDNNNILNQRIDSLSSELNEKHNNTTNSLTILNEKVNSNKTATDAIIADEITARKTTDAELQGIINVERTTREGAISALQTAVANNKTAAEEAVAVEKEARESADAGLQGLISAETEARKSADTELQNAINAEATARENAVTGEVSARKSADAELQGAIDAEATARETLAETLRDELAVETTARESADAELQGLISAETEARENAVTGEATARETLAETLRGELAVEVETLETAVTGEMEVRVAADAELQDAINAEATARKSADAELQGAIDAEATARETLAETLRDELAVETTARESADAELQNAIDAEATARENAVAELDKKIKNIGSGITLKENIIIAGGPLADDITDNWPQDNEWTVDGNRVIPAGKTLEEILRALFLKEIEGSVKWGNISWSPKLAQPKVELSGESTVEIGTILSATINVNSNVTNNVRSATCACSEGYFTSLDGEWNSSKTTTISKDGSISQNNPVLTWTWNNVSTTSKSLQVTNENENILSVKQTGVTVTVPALDETTIYASTNTKRIRTSGVDAIDTLIDNSTISERTKALESTGTDSVIGARYMFWGANEDILTLDSSNIRALSNGGAQAVGAVSGKTITMTSNGVKQFVVAIPKSSNYKLKSALNVTAMNNESVNAFDTTEVYVKGANDFDAVVYTVYYLNSESAWIGNGTTAFTITIGK